MKREMGLNPDSASGKFEVAPADQGLGAKNCIVIKEKANLSLADIARLAVENEAIEASRGDEDDIYVIQFPGYGQERLDDDKVLARLKEMRGEDGE
jgi:hypothetical protein